MRPVCLLTGFEPFREFPVNPSWEAVKGFQDRQVAGHRIATCCLPVRYDEVARPLLGALQELRPVAVVAFGVGTRLVTLEATARNGYAQSPSRDNLGRLPPRTQILPGEAAELSATLPCDRILAALGRARIGATVSQDAGGYLCNECFFRLLAYREPLAPGPRQRGFIHLPAYGTADPLDENQGYTPQKLERAIATILEAVLNP